MGDSKEGYWFQCPYDDRDSSPLLWSNHVHVRRAEVQGGRGFVMAPMGGLGQHRYPLAGSGDTVSELLVFSVHRSTRQRII
jgi:hypothetical protein